MSREKRETKARLPQPPRRLRRDVLGRPNAGMALLDIPPAPPRETMRVTRFDATATTVNMRKVEISLWRIRFGENAQ